MNWLIAQIQETLTVLSEVFTNPLFELGGKLFSLSSFAHFILFILIAFAIARAISEGIKRWFLVRFGLDRGTREAIASVIGYLLAILGFLTVVQGAGIDLRSLTVFAGALGIGFGFGLQTLASNFLSGLTLLFEQPVKVGDFIEVNGLLGTVEKIAMRSTIVRTLDGVFVIVPNNQFVENNIVNWSYKDLRCRLRISVGVAYGSDPILVTESLIAAARKDARVLAHPAPRVFFKQFGDSSLNFELLIWIDNPPETEPIKSALHFLIESELRCRGIEIPFPQRDLHIKNVETLHHVLAGRENFKEKELPPTNGKVVRSERATPVEPKAMPKAPTNWALRDLLRRISYFEQCDSAQIRELIEYGYRQLIPAHQLICKEGDPGDSFYLILTGSVEVFSAKTDQYIATLHEGEFFGEISLLMGTARTASVRTLEDTILFVVNRADLQKLLEHHQNLADRIAKKLAERQQSLRSLGLIDDEVNLDEVPFLWIRKRIAAIFGI